jgi:zinc/manganese transport system substrate-binding protein
MQILISRPLFCTETQSQTMFYRVTCNHRALATATAAAAAALALAVTGCGTGGSAASTPTGLINAVGAENEYANVLSQIGGKYVHVSAILDNPNTDPHAFEASAQVAQEVSSARLIVQNGLGYDSWINRVESATPSTSRKVIVVQNLLDLPDSTPNPHLWYDPRTMPAAARAMEADLSAIQPAHKAYFEANLTKFDASLIPWLSAIAQFKAANPHVTAATTEPVADYLLTAMGISNLTPFRFQADIMNGIDPSPEDIALENSFFSQHRVALFAYNQQVTSALTGSVRESAIKNGVPVVGVYETMPTPGFTYQSWMLAEITAIDKAVHSQVSTEHL